MLLFEAEKEVDSYSVIRLIPYLDIFILKSTMKEDEGSMRNKIREHLIWKSAKVWKAIVEKSIE